MPYDFSEEAMALDPGSASSPGTPLLPPEIPDHKLLRRIGRGSYGEVWLARNVVGTLRAVKVVYRKSFERDRPYDREFAGIQKFEPISRSHEGFVDILQIGRNDEAGYFYYVMELADDANAECETRSAESFQDTSGPIPHSALRDPQSYVPKTLRSLLRPNPQPTTLPPSCPTTARPRRNEVEAGNSQPTTTHLPLAQCLDIGLALSAALAHLHQHGLVHRDIKPSNIIFVDDPPKLADIGLVTGMSEARSYVGTDGFIPPEGPGTPQADLYSLGKVLYEMSTGKDRHDFPELPVAMKDSAERAGLSELNEIILKACAGDVRERYQSAEEMRADLALLQGGKSVRQKRTNEQRWAAGKKAGIALIVLTVIVATAVSMRRQLTGAGYAGAGPPSTNQYATALCDKAMHIIEADNYAAFPEAYTNINKAIALDPYFARAYVGLFDLRASHQVLGLPPTSPVELRTIVRKLQELAPNLAATHRAQSWMSFIFELDFPKAEKHILQAIEADPKVDPSWYGFMLTLWGRLEEARKQLEIARSITPSLAIIYRRMGHRYYAQRDYTNAIAQYRQALAWEPHHAVAYGYTGEAYRAMHDYTNALDNFERADILFGANESETKRNYAELRQAFAERGERGYWEELWRRTEKKPNGDFYWKAEIQIRLGDTNAAFAWLNHSFATREHKGVESPLIYLLFNECWDGLHDDPRFKELLDKTGFTKAMLKRKN